MGSPELAYDFDAVHLGVVARGKGAREAIVALARSLDSRLLIVRGEGDSTWAWLGSRRPLDPRRAEELLSGESTAGLSVAIGEPGEGIAAWRLTHRQALAALSVALRGKEPVVRYADVALLAAVLRDDLLAESLRRLYLEPLEAGRDGGATLCETLRAYLAAEQNASSAAAALGINRGTVAARLRVIEDRIGRPLASCAAELSVAFGLERMA